ncbi:MAG: flagellin lysine-N-methylase [Lachnospiraceae bacterium]|nr:flagellin lysine-N-methylase [Lachnospiraceae bacterium]
MLLRIPDFYDSFHCIGGKCPDNCCIGWELDIDDDTYEYYRSVQGPFGERLRANMSGAEKSSENESVSFRLQVDGRCPFLNSENLCDICLELGPDALCRICTDYPRYSFEWGDTIEKSLTLSCPEAGRLLFLNDIPVHFKEIPLNESGLDAYMMDEEYEEMGTDEVCPRDLQMAENGTVSIIDGMVSDETQTGNNEVTSDEVLAYNEMMEDSDSAECGVTFIEEYSEEDPAQIQKIAQIRNECIRILQDRTRSVADRIAQYLKVCDTPDFSLSPDTRLEILSGMEILNARWTTIKQALETFVSDKESYQRALDSYLESEDYRKYEYTYEHLLVYYTFRYFPRAAYDYNLSEKARFAVFNTMVIRDLDALRYAERGTFTFADRIEIVKDFSKQVEHSDYNIDYLMEELLFSSERTI